ncbi:MAG: hypothetical protein A2788_01140 [Candidatus Abawacabacteria bacterium RIFCSPHIGHO2_01_FULL_46_8]|uniref:Methylamine utilisation protein MauE domain-containing protein n=1 Tax=Candidatus Abawacabacteria bacterium RIFCSPHIGHO2_01_FULL_46_8 TaxID=1817815 RepID=A0A1F4XLM7_9BACT|nr:MAG: hypothetical protein A2788_01140 [Candidatus Abawacabacteria bacterium RIFCSPHIGHO2_01_FULL_46_8]
MDPVLLQAGLAIFIQVFIGLFFVVTGVAKLLEPKAKAAAIVRAYKLLPSTIIFPLVKLLPWVEGLVGIGVLVGLALAEIGWWSLWAVIVMLAIYTLAALLTIIRGIKMADCGCFGALNIDASPGATITKNVIMILAVLWLLLY